jgi:uncharacterized protein (UPF0305 family)
VTAEESLARAEQLLARVKDVRERLEQTEDAEITTELLGELVDLTRQVAAEYEQARREAGA